MRRAGSPQLLPKVLELERKLGMRQPEALGDAAISQLLAERMLEQREFQNCTIRARRNTKPAVFHQVDGAGRIDISANGGVIVLQGSVAGLAHRRLAGVLAWWARGRRDVINALDVMPPEADGDAELADALRLVLEVDPMVDPDRLLLSCRAGVVTLQGWVRSRDEQRRVELDAWYVDTVADVLNRLEIRP
jgi:osmotically-inducible protein OsmY